MRLYLLILTIALTAYVKAEYCHDTESCRHSGLTSCSGNSHLNCDPNCHQCVCASGVAECQTRDDCSSRCGPLHIPSCENGHCKCTFH